MVNHALGQSIYGAFEFSEIIEGLANAITEGSFRATKYKL
jgi:hypothetical protein